MNIVILGPQGSGKGTQAELVAEKYNLLHVETGKILRAVASSDHPLAKEIGDVMVDGRLVSDEILEEMIGAIIEKNEKGGFVFDGTPRDINQYHLINKILHKRGQNIDILILMEISEKETVKRLTSRRTCEKCGNVYNIVTKPSPNGEKCECGGNLFQRKDDFPESIKKRLQMYHQRTSVVISLAEKDGILVRMDGERPVKEIFDDIVGVIEDKYAKNTGKN